MYWQILCPMMIGACSLINKNIPAGEIWAGVPAKKLEVKYDTFV